MYSYNTQVQKTTETSPFSLPITIQTLNTILESMSTANPTDMVDPPSTRELRIHVLDCLRYVFDNAKDRNLLSQSVYKSYFDKK